LAAVKLGEVATGARTSAPPRAVVRLEALGHQTAVVELRIGHMESGAPVIVAAFDVASQSASAELALQFGLTAAQASVLASLAAVLADRDIADRHGISLATVRSHITQILSKLGVESRLQAALLAARAVPIHAEASSDSF